MTEGMVLYELGGAAGRRYSLFSWRARLALAHKGLAAEFRPVRVSDKASIAFSGQNKVPILRHGEEVITDSWRIACWLEDRFPDSPPLFGGPIGRGLARFVNSWVDRALLPRLAPLIMVDVLAHVDAEDEAHHRRSTEAAFGKPPEALAEGREQSIQGFRALLDPVRGTLRGQDFLCGAAPAYADYVLFGLFQWARVVSPFPILAEDDPVAAWRERLLDAHGGAARAEPAA